MNFKLFYLAKQFGSLLVLCAGALIGAILLGDFVTFEAVQQNRQTLVTFRDAHFGLMVLGFLSFYVLIVSFSLPGASVTSITGGFLFGLTLGTVLNVIAASIGAIAIFLAVKAGLGKLAVQKIDKLGGRMARLREKLVENEISVLLMLRLLPIIPFFAVNIVSALVGIKLKNFVFTTVLGIIPGALVFTWIGVGIGEVLDQSGTPDLSLIWSPQVLGPLIGLALLVGAPAFFRFFKSKEY
jgi:uncharacterized membrane protein YdjX (TVP38/TMEM64 family)